MSPFLPACLLLTALLVAAPPPPRRLGAFANCRGQAYGIDTDSRPWRLPGVAWANAYSEGRARASDGKSEGYLDSTGVWRIFPAFESVYPCSEGLCAVCQDANKREAKARCGYVDLNGNPSIDFIYEKVSPFESGYALTRQGSETVVITKTGSAIFRFPGHCGSGGLPGIVRCETVKGASFVDVKTGKIVLGPFQRAVPFESGVSAVVPLGSSKWVIVDAQGRPVSEKTFEKFGRFSEGFGVAWADGLCGYVSTSGDFMIPPKYFSCEDFSGGLALVRGTQGLQFIGRTGTVAISGPFRDARSFDRGYAWTIPAGMMPAGVPGSLDWWFTLIDKEGRTVFTCDDTFRVVTPKR